MQNQKVKNARQSRKSGVGPKGRGQKIGVARPKMSAGMRLLRLVMYLMPVMLGVLFAMMLPDGKSPAISKVVVGAMFVAYTYLAFYLAIKGHLPKFTVENYTKK